MAIRRSRVAGLLLVAAVTAGGAGPLGSQAPPAGRTADGLIRGYERKLQRNPHDAHTYYRLGDAYLQKARETGDPAWIERAERVIARSLALVPDQAPVVRHLAYAALQRHDFAEAAVRARRATELDAEDARAWGLLGDAHLELGEYDQAEAAYRRMAALGQDLDTLSRLSGWKSLTGDPAGAIADLWRAIAEGQESGRPREAVAWAQSQLAAEHFATGDIREAAAAYRAALATYPDYHRALAGLAGVRAAQRRTSEALDLYRKALAILPQPEYATALGDLLATLGRTADAGRQYELVEYVGRLAGPGSTLGRRELAYFHADHDRDLDRALTLAREEARLRRDVYTWDVLAWALYKTGHLDEARDAARQALRLGTRDARLFFHAGMIHHRLGERELARDYLTRALAANPHFHPRHARDAERTLRGLGGRG
jgi:tetratricopeptide (TPR) repeat protein